MKKFIVMSVHGMVEIEARFAIIDDGILILVSDHIKIAAFKNWDHWYEKNLK